jgi:hypothetical protein
MKVVRQEWLSDDAHISTSSRKRVVDQSGGVTSRIRAISSTTLGRQGRALGHAGEISLRGEGVEGQFEGPSELRLRRLGEDDPSGDSDITQ